MSTSHPAPESPHPRAPAAPYAREARPPGPRLPLLGALVGPGRDPLEMFLRFGREYGDITFFRLGAERCYFINHPQLIKDVLVTHQRNFTKSRGLERAKKLLGTGLLTAEGAEHLRHRRLLQPAFHRDRIAGYAQVMVDHAARMRERWQDGVALDVAHEMMRLTLSIVGKTLFDTDVESDADEIGGAVTEVLEHFWINLLPGANLLERLPVGRFRRVHDARERLDALIFRMIDERMASGRDHGDLLSMMILARDEAAPGAPGAPGRTQPHPAAPGLTRDEVRDEAMTLMLAGHETTANALTWTWYLLGQHPHVEAALHEELDRVLEQRLPTMADMPQLTYARRIITEAMRLYPPAWVIGRRAIAEYRLGGYRVPPRGLVFMSPYATHRDVRWYPEPERFDPGRWTSEREAALPPFAYFPFGGGARRCIGEQFAWMEALLVLATVAQRWQLQLVSNQRVIPQPLVTLRAKHGVRVTAHPR